MWYAYHSQTNIAPVLEAAPWRQRTVRGLVLGAAKARWESPQQIKNQFGSASILKGGRVVFNIGGNKFRLILSMDYGRQACYVKFIGTHRAYDAIDAETI